MTDFLLLLTGAALVNNVVLAQSLGVSQFVHAAGSRQTALGMGAAVALLLIVSVLCNHLVWHAVLVPLGLQFLRSFVFILSIATLATVLGMALHKHRPVLYAALGLQVPLLAANSAVLGVALLNAGSNRTLLQALGYGLGAALGFALVLVLFAALRERLAGDAVPEPFRGAPITLLTAGLMALAFTGFAGLG